MRTVLLFALKMLGVRHQQATFPLKRRGSQNGFTLVELLVTIVILGIVSSIAIPSMIETVRSYQITSKASYWLNVLNYARSEAAKRGTRVSLCASANGTSCTGASQSDLHQGWIIFVDTDSDGTKDAGETVIRADIAEAEYTYVLSGTTNTYVSFVSNGMTKTAGNASWSGNVKICNVNAPAGAKGRQVTISSVGRAKMENTTC